MAWQYHAATTASTTITTQLNLDEHALTMLYMHSLWLISLQIMCDFAATHDAGPALGVCHGLWNNLEQLPYVLSNASSVS